MRPFVAHRAAAALLAATVLAACSKDAPRERRSGVAAAKPAAGKDDSAGGTVDLGSTSYSPGGLSATGSVAGTIRLDGPPPPDTTPITSDDKVCGTSAPGAVQASVKGLSNVLVWIPDVKTGKALPIDKRVELSSEDCVLDPRVQAAVVGSTVDVTNDDKALHRLIFVRGGTHDTLTVMPFFNAGQVVASERLAKQPGIVEITCTRHKWTHGYIAVFDQPYFAVTEKDGSFKIESLPPGKHKMMVWHEGMTKPIEQMIDVSPGGAAKVDMAIKVGA